MGSARGLFRTGSEHYSQAVSEADEFLDVLGGIIFWAAVAVVVFLGTAWLIDVLQALFPGRRARQRNAEITRQIRHENAIKKGEALDHELDLFGEWSTKDFDKYKGLLNHSESCPICRDLPVRGKFKNSRSRET